MLDTRPTVTSRHGMVAAAHPLAATAGAGILAAGGNAFDAIAAVAGALNVVEPYMSGLAGTGIATFYHAGEGRTGVLDFVTPVPRKFDPASRKRAEMVRGPHPVAAPGNLIGWCTLAAKYGRLDRARIFAPAIRLARDGFPLTEKNAAFTNGVLAEIGGNESWRDNYAKPVGGEFVQGRVLKQPALAETYEAIVADGPAYLHSGALGRALVDFVQSLGGCLDLADLAEFEPRWQDTTVGRFAGVDVHVPPPPCEAFQLLMSLAILDGLDLANDEPDGVRHVDRVWRAIRLSADTRIRNNKPDPAKLAALFSDDAIGRLRALVEADAPVEGLTEMFPDATSTSAAKENTTSFSAIDAEGNAVCITQSLGGVYGSGIVVPGTGVCLNNFLNWGELNPQAPNFMAPGSELALPIAPSLTLKDGKPVLSLGTPGSYGICQTQTQVMVQHLVYGRPLQRAVTAPRGRLWDGKRVCAESRYDPATLHGLCARGHEVEVVDAYTWMVGGMHGIARDPETGALEGAADPRRDGYAVPVI
ncbi:MAG: gamma-glutamyltransferase [Alphaproteobacteria bacterium]